MALFSAFTASHTNWSTPFTGLSSSVARLELFRLDSPDVHVVNSLASEATHGVSRSAHALYVSQSNCVEKHSCCA
jgi:hypothetical protein